MNRILRTETKLNDNSLMVCEYPGGCYIKQSIENYLLHVSKSNKSTKIRTYLYIIVLELAAIIGILLGSI